jgi:acyl-CoA thioester hydrolase
VGVDLGFGNGHKALGYGWGVKLRGKMRDLLQNYPVVIEVPVAWGEMDAFQHVNNTVYFRYMEDARIAYYQRLRFDEITEQTGVARILAYTCCRFRRPLTYPDTLSVGARVTEVGQDRFDMAYRIVSRALQGIAAEGEATIVTYDHQVGRKVPVPNELRRRIERLESGSR